MFTLLDTLVFDPATAELVQSVVLGTGLVAAAACALALLPWTDAEIEDVDTAARNTLGRLVPQPAVHHGHATT